MRADGCVRGLASGEASGGAAIVRPPGHHAESGMAMGFCFFCNAALAARAAQVLPWHGTSRACGMRLQYPAEAVLPYLSASHLSGACLGNYALC